MFVGTIDLPCPLLGKEGNPFAWLRIICLLSVVTCAGCVARYVKIQEKGLTCTEAQHIAVNAVQRMGYTITEATKATPSSPGMIIASREMGGSKRGMMVSIFCTSLGTEVEAKSDTGGVADLGFSGEFRRSFAMAVANQPPPRAAAATGLDVLVTQERAAAATLGVDLSSSGILPVTVRITNHTSRTYRFSAADVVLQTTDGERVDPVSVKDVTAHLSSEAATTVRQKAAADTDIKTNETVSGFLFFPFKPYARAHVELTDLESDETEGFSIEF